MSVLEGIIMSSKNDILIIGRDGIQPEHMKPDAWTINEVLKILGIKSDGGIFV